VFIPLAEANGMIQRITTRVMEIVVRDAAELLRADPQLHIAINLSPDDLHSEGMDTRMKELAASAGMGPASLMFEITERGLMSPDKARGVLLAVRAGGFRVAIDDFGTGHSSLSYLATYELDFLKIDKMFVDTLGTDAPTSLVTFHIIELARSLGLQMIAEGVETEAQRDILRERGVQYAQGWLFGRPMSIQKLGTFIARASQGLRPTAVI
jgi:sensor c-di-GMP phosphodiesterase-like protein